jgi:hypothetical protein
MCSCVFVNTNTQTHTHTNTHTHTHTRTPHIHTYTYMYTYIPMQASLSQSSQLFVVVVTVSPQLHSNRIHKFFVYVCMRVCVRVCLCLYGLSIFVSLWNVSFFILYVCGQSGRRISIHGGQWRRLRTNTASSRCMH